MDSDGAEPLDQVLSLEKFTCQSPGRTSPSTEYNCWSPLARHYLGKWVAGQLDVEIENLNFWIFKLKISILNCRDSLQKSFPGELLRRASLKKLPSKSFSGAPFEKPRLARMQCEKVIDFSLTSLTSLTSPVNRPPEPLSKVTPSRVGEFQNSRNSSSGNSKFF